MSNEQRRIAFTVCAAGLLLALFPPWRSDRGYQEGPPGYRDVAIGHHSLFFPPGEQTFNGISYQGLHVDAGLLIVEGLIILCLASLVLLLRRERPANLARREANYQRKPLPAELPAASDRP